MKRNLFVEYRKWVFFWGLLLDGQEEVQKVLNKYNGDGWHCIQFEWGGSRKFTIFRLLVITVVSILTLGFLSYWTGFSLVFEKDENFNSERTNRSIETKTNLRNSDNALESWKEQNPTKPLNDYWIFRSDHARDSGQTVPL